MLSQDEMTPDHYHLQTDEAPKHHLHAGTAFEPSLQCFKERIRSHHGIESLEDIECIIWAVENWDGKNRLIAISIPDFFSDHNLYQLKAYEWHLVAMKASQLYLFWGILQAGTGCKDGACKLDFMMFYVHTVYIYMILHT